MSKKAWVWTFVAGVVGLAVVFFVWKPEYAYTPSEDKLHQQSVGGGEMESLSSEDNEKGEQRATRNMLELGRKTLYEETFGNEMFMSDIMGVANGALTVANITKAVIALNGEGTSNLRVELAEDVHIGDVSLSKGDLIDTGIDVPKGAYAPLGMPIKAAEGRIRVGVTCMACHATVHPETKRVIEGAPNNDFNLGLLMALATNSAAFFTHTDVDDLVRFMEDLKRPVPTRDGRVGSLPDPEALERAVDENFIKWPKGSFDSTIDQVTNPAQIPDSFTKGDFPYGWSGFAAAGPFHGLSVFNSNVHAQNTDSTAQTHLSRALFGLDEEVYLGTLLQNAANPRFRYDPDSGEKPSEFFARIDPNPGTPGVNEMVKPPSFPRMTEMAPDGLFLSSSGYRAGEQSNAMSVYQNKLKVPPADRDVDEDTIARGERVFRRAKCMACHSGDAYTNNRIIPSTVIGTEPSRAQSMKKTERQFGEAWFYSSDTPVPIPRGARKIRVPSGYENEEQRQLAWAHGGSSGGYKVKGLIGLNWSPPYLHDGGVAVGPGLEQLGVPGTTRVGILPDPANSLRAMVDRELRAKVVEANRRDAGLRDVHVTGEGHEFWVDESAGFAKEDQDALVEFLLSLKSPK